jgi:hypothetical protein
MENSDITAEVVQPAGRGWWSRNWLWVVPSGCLLVVLLPIGCCIGIFGGTMLVLKNSEPYQMALEQVRTNPKVIEELGEPVKEATWLPSGSINVENDSGSAVLNFEIAGPKGQAQVLARARRISGKWGMTAIEVTLKDGQRVSLAAKADSALEEAPRWQPAK